MQWLRSQWTARDTAQDREVLWDTGVVLETMQCDQNVGNAKFRGAECLGTIHRNTGTTPSQHHNLEHDTNPLSPIPGHQRPQFGYIGRLLYLHSSTSGSPVSHGYYRQISHIPGMVSGQLSPALLLDVLSWLVGWWFCVGWSLHGLARAPTVREKCRSPGAWLFSLSLSISTLILSITAKWPD
jgi:hypothetical protein